MNYDNDNTQAVMGSRCTIQPLALVGLMYRDGCLPAQLGDDCTVRAYTVIYGDVVIGHGFRSGHHALIRENTTIGAYVLIGSSTIIDGQVVIGDYVSIQSGVYIPTHTSIGSYVFIGPRATFTNDKYPLRQRASYELKGPVLADHVTVGANSTLLPGVNIGEGAVVAAGTTVTRDVPPWHLAIGSPARMQPLPDSLREHNQPTFGPEAGVI